MKAVIQDVKSGKLRVDEVPPPSLQPGGVLVRVRRSLISLGTERAVIELAKKGPIGKARERPDLARKVLNRVRQEGLFDAIKVVRNLLSSPIPLGYSCAGEVIAVGGDAAEFRVGDRVGCAGFNYANHAEVDYIPRNLAVRIPDAVDYDAACFVTVGALATHGVRLARLGLGDVVVVLGLGLVGQICAQLASAAGARVMCADPDPAKHELARRLGVDHVASSAAALTAHVHEITDGHGADAVLICAATSSSEPVREAASIARLRGRVVVVGDVGMEIDRRAYFEKELELVVSRSYGPGRYDPSYEERGVDYPYPYVRWTERRNMRAFLDLVAQGRVTVDPLITHRYPIEQAASAYEVVTGQRGEPAVAIVLEYPGPADLPARLVLGEAGKLSGTGDTVRFGVIGAGQFARGILLPAFARNSAVSFRSFCTASGFTSRAVAERYGAAVCTSDPLDVIRDDDVDAVIIATRHGEHASLAMEAMRAGKAVFLEKPLAIDEASLLELIELAAALDAPRLMVGFNRRYSPLVARMKQFFDGRRYPLSVQYRVNALARPRDSWVFDPKEGGGRIVGEVCHYVDFVCAMTDALPVRIHAEALAPVDDGAVDRDSVAITLRMSDGSVGVIHFLANGDASVSKEYVEVFGGDSTAILDNYRHLALHRGNRRRRKRLMNQAKGFAEEADAFVHAVRTGTAMPVDLDTLVAVTRTTFRINRSLDLGQAVPYADEAGEE